MGRTLRLLAASLIAATALTVMASGSSMAADPTTNDPAHTPVHRSCASVPDSGLFCCGWVFSDSTQDQASQVFHLVTGGHSCFTPPACPDGYQWAGGSLTTEADFCFGPFFCPPTVSSFNRAGEPQGLTTEWPATCWLPLYCDQLAPGQRPFYGPEGTLEWFWPCLRLLPLCSIYGPNCGNFS